MTKCKRMYVFDRLADARNIFLVYNVVKRSLYSYRFATLLLIINLLSFVPNFQ